MEFLQFILNFLTGGSQGQFKELFTLLEQNNFNLQEVIKNLDFEKLAPILSAFSGEKEYDKDDSAEVSPRISGMKIVDGKFNYYTTGFLRETYFSGASKNPLQLDFANKAKVKAIVKVSFE